MRWIIAIIGILVSLYFGTVIGLYSLCEETPEFYKAKKYVAFIPGFTLLFIIFGFLFGDKNDRAVLLHFLRVPYKCIIILAFFAEVVAEEKNKNRKKVPPKTAVFSGTFNLLQNILTDKKPFYY